MIFGAQATVLTPGRRFWRWKPCTCQDGVCSLTIRRHVPAGTILFPCVYTVPSFFRARLAVKSRV